MGQSERDRLKVMSPVMDGRRTQAVAARPMKRSVRQVRKQFAGEQKFQFKNTGGEPIFSEFEVASPQTRPGRPQAGPADGNG